MWRFTHSGTLIRQQAGSIVRGLQNRAVLPDLNLLGNDYEAGVQRSWLYVPSSSDRKLTKSVGSESDMLIYDLEDSVSPTTTDKAQARERLRTFLNNDGKSVNPRRVSIRVNDVTTSHFELDISSVSRMPAIQTLVIPKVNTSAELDRLEEALLEHSQDHCTYNVVASIESARAMWNIGYIAGWQQKYTLRGAAIKLNALLFAAEDYCADTSIIRTASRKELLYSRSQLVVAAKAFKLDAIDMVCVNYKDPDYLQEECKDGRQLGFTGKQAIHPAQVSTIQSTFVPSEQDIFRAVKILNAMTHAHESQLGAVGLDVGDGITEMIDAPMLKQAQNTLKLASLAKLTIPLVDS